MHRKDEMTKMKNNDFWANEELAEKRAGEIRGDNILYERTRMNEVSEKNKKEMKAGTIAGIAAGGVTIAALCFFVGTQVSGNNSMRGGMGGPGGAGGPGGSGQMSTPPGMNGQSGNAQGGPGGANGPGGNGGQSAQSGPSGQNGQGGGNNQGGPGGVNGQNSTTQGGPGGTNGQNTQGGPGNRSNDIR